MIKKHNGFKGKIIIAVALCLFILTSGISFAEQERLIENNELEKPPELTQVNLQEASVENALFPEDKVISSDKENEEVNLMKSSTLRLTKSPLTAFYIESIISKDLSMGKPREVIDSFPTHGILFKDYNLRTQYKHYKDEVAIKLRVVGNPDDSISAEFDGKKIYPGQTYEHTVDPRTGQLAAWSQDYTIKKVDSDISVSKLIIKTFAYDYSKPNPGILVTRNLTIDWENGGDLPPTTPEFTYNSEYPEQYILSGVNHTMEYRLKEDTNWTPCTNAPIRLDIPPSGFKTYYVRYAATDEKVASQLKEILLKPRRGAPTVSYNGSNEAWRELSTDMEIKVDNSTYFPVTNEVIEAGITPYLDEASSENGISIMIRLKGNDKMPPSLEKNLKLNPRFDKPTTLIYDKLTFTLKGVSKAMEYRGPEDTSWRSIPNSTINLENYASNEEDVNVEVRFKSTSTKSASKPVVIIISKLMEAPKGNLDFKQEIIVGLEPEVKYQYRINTGSWTNIQNENGKINISRLISSSSDRTIYIRKAATLEKPVSAYIQFFFPKREKGPQNVMFIYNNLNHPEKAVMEGITSDMEYKKSTDKDWVSPIEEAIIVDIPKGATSYNVRYKANESNFASQYQNIVLYAPPAAPSISYSSTTEIMSGFTSKMEWSFNDGAYMPVESSMSTYNTTEKINTIAAGEYVSVNIRVAARKAAPASAVRTIILNPRALGPSNIKYDIPSFTITGVDSTMQYKRIQDLGWNSISGSMIKVEKYANEINDVVIEVRYKPTNSLSASESILINIPKLSKTPSV